MRGTVDELRPKPTHHANKRPRNYYNLFLLRKVKGSNFLNPFYFSLFIFTYSLRRLVEAAAEVCLVSFDDAACCAEEVFAEDSPLAAVVPVPAAAFAVGFHLAAVAPAFDPDLVVEVLAVEAVCFVAAAELVFPVAGFVAACLVAVEAFLRQFFVADLRPGSDLAAIAVGARFCSCYDAAKNVSSSCHFYQGFAS